ncbi:MAG: acyltransferase [Propionibacteriaceae bacterium]|nr:acyltransferase [Propionibacteriaceae bacterium]
MARVRNHVIDVARAASVGVVVIFHGLLYRVRLDDGVPAVVPWAAPTYLYPLTWVLMIMPLFFVAGGFGHALTIDRMRAEGATYAHFVASRGRRLVGPLVVFVTFCTLLGTLAAWAGYVTAAVDLSRALMQLLWFISVYLVIVAVAPLLVSAHDRFGALPMIALVVAASIVDTASFRLGEPGLRNLNMAFVWPLVHQFGIAYERGWFRRGQAWTPWAALVAGGAGVVFLVFVAGYPPTSVGFADLPIANIQPPTLAMAALALAQCGALALVERSGALATIPPRAERALAVLNALMVTTYLWHIFCILLAGLGLLALAMALPLLAPLLLNQLTVALAGLVVVALVVPWIGRLELRLIPRLGEVQDATAVTAAYALLTAGTIGVWQFGTVLHPAARWSAAAVGLVWVGSWLMGHAADARPLRHPVAEWPG